MSRKNYINFANMIVNLTIQEQTKNKDFTNKYLVNSFCYELSLDNHRFDSHKFRSYIDNKLNKVGL